MTGLNIIESGFQIAAAVKKFRIKVRSFFYKVMLMGHCCPACNGSLSMIAEGLCRCGSCGYELDPTIAFQRCLECGGVPILRVRRYSCKNCGVDVVSKFLFEGLVYDKEYFARKMAQSRERKTEQRKHMREMVIENRSETLSPEPLDLESVPGLIDALNGLSQDIDEPMALELKNRFDLHRYQDHVNKHVDSEPVDIKDIPPIIEDLRLDLIWRFVATVFLEHYGQVDMQQEGQRIWVMKHDDRKGQGFFDGFTEIDGFEGYMG